MKIGLYFGSFNPIHNGHLIIARHVLNVCDVEELWFIVSPQNPLKAAGSLLNEHDRLNLIQVSIIGEVQMKASSVEFKLPKPSFTIDTLTYLGEKYIQHSFKVIMGSDSFQNLPKWKNFEKLLEEYEIIVYKRPGFNVLPGVGSMVTMLDAPLLEISSTHIRELIRSKKSIRYLVPDPVKEEIEKNNYYTSKLKNPS